MRGERRVGGRANGRAAGGSMVFGNECKRLLTSIENHRHGPPPCYSVLCDNGRNAICESASTGLCWEACVSGFRPAMRLCPPTPLTTSSGTLSFSLWRDSPCFALLVGKPPGESRSGGGC